MIFDLERIYREIMRVEGFYDWHPDELLHFKRWLFEQIEKERIREVEKHNERFKGRN